MLRAASRGSVFFRAAAPRLPVGSSRLVRANIFPRAVPHVATRNLHGRVDGFDMRGRYSFRIFATAMGLITVGSLWSLKSMNTTPRQRVDVSLIDPTADHTRYPEISWLVSDDVRMTQEGNAASGSSPSENLFGKKFVEFDRTMMTLKCMKLILDGGDAAYSAFTSDQPEDVRLKRKDFDALHDWGVSLLRSDKHGLSVPEMYDVMAASLVLGDIGKSEKARALFEKFGCSAPDHDDFHTEVMQVLVSHPDLCPTFAALPKEGQQLLIRSAGLAHYGHITHLEGGPVMFENLAKGVSEIDLSLDLFVHFCDVAGALGHINGNSSLVYNNLTRQSMGLMRSCVESVAKGEKSIQEAYFVAMEERASWLGLDDMAEGRVLGRIGAMTRLFSPQDGAQLKKGWEALSFQDRADITRAFIEPQKLAKRTPTYMPALLVNLMGNKELGETRDERLRRAIMIGLPFCARAILKHEEMIREKKISPNIPLCFNAIAGVAKTKPSLLGGMITIDKDGNVGTETI